MATANDLLTRAIDETKHLNHNEIFLVRDLFKGYEWNRISRSDRLLLGTLFLNYVHTTGMNEARFSNIFIEKRASTCPQSLEKSRLFSYALLVSECENFQNMKRIFLRKVVI